MCVYVYKQDKILNICTCIFLLRSVMFFSLFFREKKQQNYHIRKSVTMTGSITNLMSSLESDLTWEAVVSDRDPSPLCASAISITPRSLLHFEWIVIKIEPMITNVNEHQKTKRDEESIWTNNYNIFKVYKRKSCWDWMEVSWIEVVLLSMIRITMAEDHGMHSGSGMGSSCAGILRCQITHWEVRVHVA